MYETVKTKKQIAVGFIVERPQFYKGSRYYRGIRLNSIILYVPKGKLKLGEATFLMEEGYVELNHMTEPGCSQGCCRRTVFEYGAKSDSSTILDSKGINFQEITKVPEWADKTRNDAVVEFKAFIAECGKTHIKSKQEKSKKLSRWQRFCNKFKNVGCNQCW